MTNTQNVPTTAPHVVVMEGDGFVLDPSSTIVTEDGTVLYQVVATRMRQRYTVQPGSAGGYVTTADNITDDAWAFEGSQIIGFSVRMQDDSKVVNSVISGVSVIAQTANIHDSHVVDSVVRDKAYVENSWLNRATIYGGAVIEKSTVRSGSTVGGNSVMVSQSEITNKSTVRNCVVTDSLIDEATVAQNAVVRNSAVVEGSDVTGPVEITDNSVIEGKSKVSNGAVIIRSTVSGESRVEDDGQVVDSALKNSSVVWGSGAVFSSTLDGIALQARDRVHNDIFDTD